MGKCIISSINLCPQPRDFHGLNDSTLMFVAFFSNKLCKCNEGCHRCCELIHLLNRLKQVYEDGLQLDKYPGVIE